MRSHEHIVAALISETKLSFFSPASSLCQTLGKLCEFVCIVTFIVSAMASKITVCLWPSRLTAGRFLLKLAMIVTPVCLWEAS